jgi:peptide-methionine (S)-S-oxide reductase
MIEGGFSFLRMKGRRMEMPDLIEIATIGAGCFWCVQEIFGKLKGVEEAVAGYAGGRLDKPTYEQVCSGKSGHVEAVQIMFRPVAITYRDVLDVFWDIHDPTTLNRQGNDEGEQYRSVVFYHSSAQRATAELALKELTDSGRWSKPVVTAIEPFRNFFGAEEYHQYFFRKNPDHAYCRLIISPKMEKFREHYAGKLRAL